MEEQFFVGQLDKVQNLSETKKDSCSSPFLLLKGADMTKVPILYMYVRRLEQEIVQ